MSVYDVPEGEWDQFCRRLARQHAGELLSVERIHPAGPGGRNAESELLAAEAPLRELRVEAGDGVAVFEVGIGDEVGDGPDKGSHVRLEKPTAVVLEQHGQDEPGVLWIESVSGERLMLSFSEPFLPGTMNGLP